MPSIFRQPASIAQPLFLGAGRPTQGDPINSLHLGFSSGELKHSIRELCSQLPYRRVIEKVQGLRRDQRFAPLQAIRIHGRKIETFQQRRWLLPKVLDINAAAFA
jgi:hypothetical protein